MSDDGSRRTVSGLVTDEERALYGLYGTDVVGCRFEGPADGESALKECRDIRVRDCAFSLRYPLWHARGFTVESCAMTGDCRAPLWYCSDGTVRDTVCEGVKCLRECDRISIEGSRFDSPEFGWKCRGIRIDGCRVSGEYAFLDSSDLELSGLRLDGKYSFQYVRGVTVRDGDLRTKDAFWHSRDVTVEDSVVSGEYLGWYSEDLTLVRCRISGTQPLCYCRNLRLVDCTMEGADLAFEYSDVEATVDGRIDSVKNPRSGSITADDIGEVVLGDAVMGCDCRIARR